MRIATPRANVRTLRRHMPFPLPTFAARTQTHKRGCRKRFSFSFFSPEKKTLKDPVIHRLVVELFSFLLCTLKKQGCLLLPVLSIVITDQPTYASLLPPTTHTHPINPTPTTNTCPRGFSLVLLRKPVREEERCVGWSQSDDPTAC